MSTKLPFFSVIIPTYNRTHLLGRALDSLLWQTEKDWEGIIIDDGSTDGTSELVKKYIAQDTRLRYKKIKHGGVAKAKNAGIILSKGKFVAFLDSDDEYKKNHLSVRHKLLDQNPGVQFLHGGIQVIGDFYVPDRFRPGKKILLSQCIIGGGFCVERKFLRGLKGFKNVALGEDSELFDRAEAAKVWCQEVKTKTYIYHRENPDSITHALSPLHRAYS